LENIRTQGSSTSRSSRRGRSSGTGAGAPSRRRAGAFLVEPTLGHRHGDLIQVPADHAHRLLLQVWLRGDRGTCAGLRDERRIHLGVTWFQLAAGRPVALGRDQRRQHFGADLFEHFAGRPQAAFQIEDHVVDADRAQRVEEAQQEGSLVSARTRLHADHARWQRCDQCVELAPRHLRLLQPRRSSFIHGGGRRLRRTTDAVGKLVPHVSRQPS
jgi:hypothetical protein